MSALNIINIIQISKNWEKHKILNAIRQFSVIPCLSMTQQLISQLQRSSAHRKRFEKYFVVQRRIYNSQSTNSIAKLTMIHVWCLGLLWKLSDTCSCSLFQYEYVAEFSIPLFVKTESQNQTSLPFIIVLIRLNLSEYKKVLHEHFTYFQI